MATGVSVMCIRVIARKRWLTVKWVIPCQIAYNTLLIFRSISKHTFFASTLIECISEEIYNVLVVAEIRPIIIGRSNYHFSLESS